MKILVTGGSGFIGSHLVDALVSIGHKVINIDDCSADNDVFYFNDKAENHKVSICNLEQLLELSVGCDFIFHLAAESRLQLATKNPKKAIDVNITGTLNVLECCKKNNIKGLLFSSTSSVYGSTKNLPIKETEKENCLNPYASTKYAAELLIRNYNELYGIKSCIFRYFNVFGERAPSKGQYALVTSIFMRQKKNKEPLTVVGDGTQKRDFIHVSDIVSANILAMELWNTVSEISECTPFNIGSASEISIIDLAKTISSDIIHIPNRTGDAENNMCSNDKFVKLTGWIPSVTVFDWLLKKKG
jgi:UDP-glucose 4-epimerase